MEPTITDGDDECDDIDICDGDGGVCSGGEGDVDCGVQRYLSIYIHCYY